MKQQTPIDLTPFCSTEKSGYGLEKPFIQNGHTCATDGRILVRVPEVLSGFEEKEKPNVGELMDGMKHCPPDQWAPWPDEPEANIGQVPCEPCDGAGRIGAVTCAVCNGVGSWECPCCSSYQSSDKCKGRGRSRGEACEACSGTGEVVGVASYTVNGHRFNPRYVRLINALPGVRFCHVKYTTFFKFDGGDGAVARLKGD